MAEAALVIEQLTQDMIDQGAQLVVRLDKLRISVRVAMWFLDDETGQWRLLLACPEIRTIGPKALYKRVRSILLKMSNPYSIPLDRIAIMDPQSRVFKSFIGVIGTSEEISGIRFTNNVINGLRITDAYIYRQTLRRA